MSMALVIEPIKVGEAILEIADDKPNWPLGPSPQQETRPSDDKAHVCRIPLDTFTIVETVDEDGTSA